MLPLVLASSTGTGVGMAVGGIAAVLVISAVFYVVGRGEDRERAGPERRAEPDDHASRPGEAPEPNPHASSPQRPGGVRRRPRR